MIDKLLSNKKGLILSGILAIGVFILLILGVVERLFMLLIGVAMGLLALYLFQIYLAKKDEKQAREQTLGIAKKLANVSTGVLKKGYGKMSNVYDSMLDDSREDEDYDEEEFYEDDYEEDDEIIEEKEIRSRPQKQKSQRSTRARSDYEEDDEPTLMTVDQWEEERAKVEKVFESKIKAPKNISYSLEGDKMVATDTRLDKEDMVEIAIDEEEKVIRVYGRGLLIDFSNGQLRVYSDTEQDDISDMDTNIIKVKHNGNEKELETLGLKNLEIDNEKQLDISIESEDLQFETLEEENSYNGISWV